MIPDEIKAQLTEGEAMFLNEAIRQAKATSDGIIVPGNVVIAAGLPMSPQASENLLRKLENLGVGNLTGRRVIGGPQFKLASNLL
jgi:hypothetical protein